MHGTVTRGCPCRSTGPVRSKCVLSLDEGLVVFDRPPGSVARPPVPWIRFRLQLSGVIRRRPANNKTLPLEL